MAAAVTAAVIKGIILMLFAPVSVHPIPQAQRLRLDRVPAAR